MPDVRRKIPIELAKTSLDGGDVERARSIKLRNPLTFGSNDARARLKSTRQAMIKGHEHAVGTCYLMRTVVNDMCQGSLDLDTTMRNVDEVGEHADTPGGKYVPQGQGSWSQYYPPAV